MPSRNTVREFAPDSYYHVYNRGVEKRHIFLDEQDYRVFIGLLKRYLSHDVHRKPDRHLKRNVSQHVSLLAYCLMPNHYHLLLYQTSEDGVTQLMRRVITGYVMYFNDRYQRVGALFQSKYKASHINADAYLHHISRYIHQNPDKYETWSASSLPYYLNKKKTPTWLNTAPVLELFQNDAKVYHEFLKEYEENRQELAELKWQLANDLE